MPPPGLFFSDIPWALNSFLSQRYASAPILNVSASRRFSVMNMHFCMLLESMKCRYPAEISLWFFISILLAFSKSIDT
ncbi:hypothetical protein D3C78_1622360 [compost metagenome]